MLQSMNNILYVHTQIRATTNLCCRLYTPSILLMNITKSHHSMSVAYLLYTNYEQIVRRASQFPIPCRFRLFGTSTTKKNLKQNRIMLNTYKKKRKKKQLSTKTKKKQSSSKNEENIVTYCARGNWLRSTYELQDVYLVKFITL